MRCQRVRMAPAAALFLLTALLLLLLPAPQAESLLVHNPSSLVTDTRPTPPPEWAGDEDDEALPEGAVRTRDRYVPGHARAHAELCPAHGATARLVILVPSAPAHAAQRQAVRLTWGHPGRRRCPTSLDRYVVMAFVLGVPPTDLRASIDAEDELYGDIIEGHYVDSYGNLTLKTLSMLEWFISYCPRAARLLKADDDMFINVDEVLRFADAPARRHATRTVWGTVGREARPARDAGSKYFVPVEEFPGQIYPPYAIGAAYLVSGDAAGALLRAALGARWLRLEDVLVTGVAAARGRVLRVDVPAFLRRRADVAATCALRAALAVLDVPYVDQLDLWLKLHDLNAKCPS